MQCPKCDHEQADANEICETCGLVFAKYWKYHSRDGESGHDILIEPDPPFSWREFLLSVQSESASFMVYGRACLWGLLALYSIRLIFSGFESNAAGESFLHMINLPFHEAGHVIFGFLGQFVGSLGGTLMQLLMPAACCYVFLVRQRNIFAASVALWWFGENFLDIAPYINDASKGVLPLLGGNTGQHAPYGFHDWEYLLTETGLIGYDSAIATMSHVTGSLLMAAALLWGGIVLRSQYQNLN